MVMKSLKGLGGMVVGAGALALSITSVSAADLRTPVVKAIPPAVVAPAFSWTGFYIGGHVGAMRGKADFGSSFDVLFPGFVTVGGLPAIAPIVIVPSRFATIPGVSGTNTSFVGGGQIGYNWQINNFLLGFETDASWTRVRAGAAFAVPDPFLVQTLTGSTTAQIDWTASLRARVGVTFDRVLLYATGGAAFAGGKVNSSFALTTPVAGIVFPIPSSGTTTSSTNFSRIGWTIGGGLEWAFDRNWSLAGEYRYSDFGTRTVTLANTDPAGTASLGIVPQNVGMRLRTDEATVRLNYRFDAGPVVARY
jgi:outer membrane immunogenic protein